MAIPQQGPRHKWSNYTIINTKDGLNKQTATTKALISQRASQETTPTIFGPGKIVFNINILQIIIGCLHARRSQKAAK